MLGREGWYGRPLQFPIKFCKLQTLKPQTPHVTANPEPQNLNPTSPNAPGPKLIGVWALSFRISGFGFRAQGLELFGP